MIHLIKTTINNFLKQEFPQETNFKFNIEIPLRSNYGDLSTNVVMIYGKKTQNINIFVEKIINILKNLSIIHDVSYVAPGFLNIDLHGSVLESVKKPSFILEGDRNISVEYASPNPTGPCHMGHGRGAIIGDIICSVLTYLGYKVRKDCFFNDAGKQVDHFIESVFLRYKELKGEKIILENLFYKGDYIILMAKKYEGEQLSREEFFKKKTEILEFMKGDMEKTLNKLKIHHDIITYESQLQKEQKICWELLKEKNLLEYEKTERGQKLLFKSTQFQDDKDRVIEREDGTITYFGNDIAYHLKKKNSPYQETYAHQIIILGDDHIGYLKRLAAAVSNLDIHLNIVTHNLVKIFKNKEEIKMSKRNGIFVTIDDFLKNYGNQDLLRILLLEQSYSSVLHLDLENIVFENSSLFYIQYAYARLWSILKKNTISTTEVAWHLLSSGEDKKLITLLVYWEEFIQNFYRNLDTHILLLYIKNFCKTLHVYFTNHPIFQEYMDLQNARLYLMKKCILLLEDMMNILKIEILERM